MLGLFLCDWPRKPNADAKDKQSIFSQEIKPKRIVLTQIKKVILSSANPTNFNR